MNIILRLVILIPFLNITNAFAQKTPENVVDLIKKNVTCNWANKTVDTYKAGNPGTPLAHLRNPWLPTAQQPVRARSDFINV